MRCCPCCRRKDQILPLQEFPVAPIQQHYTYGFDFVAAGVPLPVMKGVTLLPLPTSAYSNFQQDVAQGGQFSGAAVGAVGAGAVGAAVGGGTGAAGVDGVDRGIFDFFLPKKNDDGPPVSTPPSTSEVTPPASVVTPRAPGAHPSKKAILVGCNYPGTKAALLGCVNDVYAIQVITL